MILSRKNFTSIILILFAIISYKFIFLSKSSSPLDFNSKFITINNNGFFYEIQTQAQTVSDLLSEQKIPIGDHDLVFPEKSSRLFPGMKIDIIRAVKISIKVDGKNIEAFTLRKNVFSALEENQIKLNTLDKVYPGPLALAEPGMEITITRINREEKTAFEDVTFKTVYKDDSKLGWREQKTETRGENGKAEVKYLIEYKNGEEVSRKLLEKNIVREPVSEVIIKGTRVEYGKSHSGKGTWYSFKGGLFAANPWLPLGSYVKVTNRANGKSVIVQINDRGPFGPGRIIDLDKVAFQKIAPLGAGVIDVKMEEILN